MDMDTFRGPDSPVTVEGSERPDVSRAVWLVKWLLAFPHYIALAFLAIGAVFAWFWALLAILITGRYPRGAFDYDSRAPPSCPLWFRHGRRSRGAWR